MIAVVFCLLSVSIQFVMVSKLQDFWNVLFIDALDIIRKHDKHKHFIGFHYVPV